MKQNVIEGILVEENPDTGITTYKPLQPKIDDNRSWFQKMIDWFKISSPTPYIKIRDAADPFGDRKDGEGSKTCYEIGVKFKF